MALIHLDRGEEGFATARRALELDPGAADAWATLAYWRKGEGDYEGAERYFERALENDPGNGKMHNRLARLLLEMGRVDDAGPHVLEARRLDPMNPDIFAVMMTYQLAIGEFAAAAAEGDSWSRMWASQLPKSHTQDDIAEAYTMAGRFEEAIASFHVRHPDEPLYDAWVRARQGRVVEARSMIDAFLAEHPDHEDHEPDQMAKLYAAVGDFDKAFACLERLVDARGLYPLWVRYPMFASFRADPRWVALSVRLDRALLGGGQPWELSR
jgi:tetratricopeptide (TPR) repeat protein